MKAAEEANGPIEVLVANAGITDDQLLMRMSDDSFESVVDTNLTGSFRIVKRVIRSMMRKKKGRIVLISSVVGLYGSPGQINYAASRQAWSASPGRSPVSSVPAASPRTSSPPATSTPT